MAQGRVTLTGVYQPLLVLSQYNSRRKLLQKETLLLKSHVWILRFIVYLALEFVLFYFLYLFFSKSVEETKVVLITSPGADKVR